MHPQDEQLFFSQMALMSNLFPKISNQNKHEYVIDHELWPHGMFSYQQYPFAHHHQSSPSTKPEEDEKIF
jgi:hypothetical protein